MFTVTILVTLIGIWWFCVYVPVRMFGLSYMQQNQLIRQQCDNGTQECHLLPSLETTVKELHYDLDVYSAQTSYDAKEGYINDVVLAIRTSGLSLSAYKTEREIDKKFYTKSIMQLSLSGGYQQLLQFLEEMHTKKMLISCKNITLHALESDKYTIACELAFFSLNKEKPSNLE